MRKCVSCERLGKSCGGPDFYLLSPSELTEWCKARKIYMGLSNAKVSELSGVPRGTVDSFFASARPDFRYDTIRNILVALIGGPYDGDPCRAAQEDGKEAEKLLVEMDAMQDEIAQEKQHHAEDIAQEKQRHAEDIAFVKAQLAHEQLRVRGMRRSVIALGVLLGVTLFLIIVALLIDKLDPNVGFFWLRSMIRGSRM